MSTHNLRICGKEKYQIIFNIKGSIFLKNRHFIIQERFHKLVYGINTIIKCGIWQPVKFQFLVSWAGSKMKWFFFFFFRISELMLPTLIQRYNKNHFIFDSLQKLETNWDYTDCQMPHFMIVLIPYVNFIIPFMDKKKCIFLRKMEPLKTNVSSLELW